MNRSSDLDNIAPDDPILNVPSQNNDKDIPETSEFIDYQSRQKIQNILGTPKKNSASFLVNPKVFDFPEREEGEEIFLAIRSHWLINLKWILLAIIMLFIPIPFKFFDFFSSMPFNYKTIFITFWYILTFVYAFEHFLSWYFDVFVITDQRLVDIKFNNLLNKHFAEVSMDKIQDISSSVRGLFGTFFNFGNILVQTASEINQMTLRNVPKPEKIIKLLQEIRSGNSEVKQGDSQ